MLGHYFLWLLCDASFLLIQLIVVLLRGRRRTYAILPQLFFTSVTGTFVSCQGQVNEKNLCCRCCKIIFVIPRQKGGDVFTSLILNDVSYHCVFCVGMPKGEIVSIFVLAFLHQKCLSFNSLFGHILFRHMWLLLASHVTVIN